MLWYLELCLEVCSRLCCVLLEKWYTVYDSGVLDALQYISHNCVTEDTEAECVAAYMTVEHGKLTH